MEAFKEVIQILAAVATIVIAGALFYHRRAVSLQKNALQATLFNELVGNVNKVFDEQKKYEEKKETLHWYVLLFNAFEQFAFFANHAALSVEMRNYYRSAIVEYYSYANKKKDVREYFRKRPEGQFDELAKYYENVTGKKPPF